MASVEATMLSPTSMRISDLCPMVWVLQANTSVEPHNIISTTAIVSLFSDQQKKDISGIILSLELTL